MSPQADYVVSNGTGAAVRSDINGQLAAIVSNNSGATAPSTTYAYMLWADTSTNLLKLRNGANSAWITVGDLTAANLGLAALASPTFTGTVTIPTATISTGAGIPLGSAASPTIYFTGDTNTGIYSPGADQFAITTGGSGRVFVDSSGRVGLGTSSPNSKLDIVGTGADGEIRTGNGTVNAQWYQDTGIGASVFGTYSNHAITFRTNATRAVTIDTSQRVGIGTAVPQEKLHVSGDGIRIDRNGGEPYVDFYTSGSSNNVLLYGSSTGFRVHTGGSEALRVDSSRRLLVGTSTARSTIGFDNTPQVQIEGINASSAGVSIVSNANNAGAPFLYLAKSRGGSVGSNTIVQSGDGLGFIQWSGNDGSQFEVAAQIYCEVDGTPGANDMPGRLVFSVTRDGQSSPTESLRISNNGAFDAYTGAAGDGIAVHSSNAAGTSVNLFSGYHSATSTQNGTGVFAVRSNGNVYNTNGTYGTLSDVKLKENIVDAKSQWADIKALQVRNFNFKEGQTHRQIGFIAQEVEQVSPGLVSDSPDRDEDGNETGEVTKQVNLSVLYIKAVKALQEAMERIETLEAEVAALKGA